jgi:hypothetical protein
MSAVQRASKDGKSLDPARARDTGADAYITGALLKIGPEEHDAARASRPPPAHGLSPNPWQRW